jgi:hypothetical protein
MLFHTETIAKFDLARFASGEIWNPLIAISYCNIFLGQKDNGVRSINRLQII